MTRTVKSCTEAEILANAGPAGKTGQLYAPVEVIVMAVLEGDGAEARQIEIAIRGDLTARRYLARWQDTADMWAPCPSTLPSSARPGVPCDPPAPGSFGTLYLSESFLTRHDLMGASSTGLAAEPKWPPRLPGAILVHDLEIYPLKLELTGVELRTGRYRIGTVDLLRANEAGPAQKLELDGHSPVTVSLTPTGFERFHVPFVPSSRDIARAFQILSGALTRDTQATAWALRVIADAAAFIAAGGDPAELSDEARKLLERIPSLMQAR